MDGQYDPDYRQVEAFIALQILGGALFVLTALSAFIAQLRGGSRHPTFFSFCFAWVLFCVSYSLLYFAGQQGTRPEHGLCVVQSALVYAAPPLYVRALSPYPTLTRNDARASSATISLVTHLLLNVLLALSRTADKRRSSLSSAALVLVPWVIWVAVFVGVLLFGIHHSDLVQISPNGTFCILTHTTLPKLTSVWATIASTVLVSEEAVIAILLYRNREVFSAGLGRNKTMAIRVGIFTALGVAAIAVALVYTVTQKRGVQFDLLIAAIPPSAAVIFGTQKDILQVWVFWRKYDHTESHATEGSAVLTTILSSRMTASIPSHPVPASQSV
ncbi:hypothetical protein LshimejAT787_0601230 [Lyophyllum shimeji]|uniref:Uncharacterized protein n=1 Tax=Lyophyllum shimeji TaxID=47721 RepID=A0A9P3PNN7_LYOSH|nr:hypothetical protein LshimejAT787_0601230 [Lyophyllum shimeji]